MSLLIVCALYQGQEVHSWSKDVFSPEWADKLYRGCRRNLSGDFRFVCLVDREYQFQEPIEAVPFVREAVNNQCLLECLRPDLGNEQRLFMGLDTIITGNLDPFVEYRPSFSMIRDPYFPERNATGVMSFRPEVAAPVWEKFLTDENRGDHTLKGKGSDMIWLNANLPKVQIIDDAFPGQVLSYKVHIRDGDHRVENARIIYFHGEPKPHNLDEPWVNQHWK